jgi:hypothetical protein
LPITPLTVPTSERILDGIGLKAQLDMAIKEGIDDARLYLYQNL